MHLKYLTARPVTFRPEFSLLQNLFSPAANVTASVSAQSRCDM